MYKKYIKRILDFSIAFIGFIIIFPILLMVTLLLAITNQGKPFFFQTRPGLNERFFKIIKFKTLNDKVDAQGNLLPDAKRMTKVGTFIRKSSLDELPQLINVLKGDMSLIGPRPLLVEYLPLYNEEQRKRHNVKPGITGWAQVNGRNAISWEQKFELDVWYVKHLSFLLDVKILLMTIKKIFNAGEISPAGLVTMPRFEEINKE